MLQFCVTRVRANEDIELAKTNFDVLKGLKFEARERSSQSDKYLDEQGAITMKWKNPKVSILLQG